MTRPFEPRNYLSRVRGVALLPEEQGGEGLSRWKRVLLDEPSSSGQLLIATTQRILFFRDDGRDQGSNLAPGGRVERASW